MRKHRISNVLVPQQRRNTQSMCGKTDHPGHSGAFRRRNFFVLLVYISILFPLWALAEDLPARVDLRPYQTAIRHQGARRTCIVFGAIAALEAAYIREGYRAYDLSEEFANHLGKTFWLHPNWKEIATKGEDGSETQVAAFGGGNGSGYVEFLAKGLRVPREAVMPYWSEEYPVPYDWWESHWSVQRNQSDFNLAPTRLTEQALKASQYFSVKTYRTLSDPRSAKEIERVLAQGYSVVWDFNVANTNGPIWRPCGQEQPNCPSDAHSMLLVGYDRTDPDPANHYVIAKNSWGPTNTPGADGFTYIAYDYLRYGISASYIVAVNPPQAWPELAFVGRWDLTYAGWTGTLDIYHLPGLMQWVFDQQHGIRDRRIGSFYDENGRAYKVNGDIRGDAITFYIDGDNPNARWDQLGGRRFDYRLSPGLQKNVMYGNHLDPDGQTYSGYAERTVDTRDLGLISMVDGQFAEAAVLATGESVGGWHYGARNTFAGTGDFNGDGLADLILMSTWGIGILTYDGSSWQPLLVSPNGSWFGYWHFSSLDNAIQGIGDFNGDGKDDLLMTSTWGIGLLTLQGATLTHITMAPNGTRFGGWLYDSVLNTIAGVGDIDGNGTDDIVITSDWGIGLLTCDHTGLTTLMLAPNGTRFGGWLYDAKQNTIERLGDFNGDGTADLLITSAWGIGLLTLQGATLTHITLAPNGTRFGGWLYDSALNTIAGVGDIDGNGTDDIVITSDWGIGLLTFDQTALTTLVLAPNGASLGGWSYHAASTSIILLGDVDADGRDDLVLRNEETIGMLSWHGMTLVLQDVVPNGDIFGNWRGESGDMILGTGGFGRASLITRRSE